jgi:hypothetical protein
MWAFTCDAPFREFTLDAKAVFHFSAGFNNVLKFERQLPWARKRVCVCTLSIPALEETHFVVHENVQQR